MSPQKTKKEERCVAFEHPPATPIMAIDGTWRRRCVLLDVSESGATLEAEGSVEGLSLKEFFLLLSSTGLAYRRCELDWVNGGQIGIKFVQRRGGPKEDKGPAELL